MLSKIPQHAAEYGAVASGSSAIVSYTATNLPVVQYVAGCIAIVSGALASAWVIFKFYGAYKAWKVRKDAA
jgi:hypothetical protein